MTKFWKVYSGSNSYPIRETEDGLAILAAEDEELGGTLEDLGFELQAANAQTKVFDHYKHPETDESVFIDADPEKANEWSFSDSNGVPMTYNRLLEEDDEEDSEVAA